MASTRRDIFKMLDGITNRRGVGYARYSSDMQKDGWTIQAQTRTITDHLTAKGIPIEAITKDEAKSGKTTNRAGLQEALTIIRAGRANMLVVAKLDRATRALFDALGLDRELKEYGASLYCIEENIDTADPNAMFMFQMHAIMAQRYRENLAFETAKGKRERVEEGLANGDPPYGYRRATEADVPGFTGDAEALIKVLRRLPYIQVPERAEAVKLAFELCATGYYSDTDIAQELNRRGYRMVSKRQPHGGPFKKDTMTALLREPFYCGRVSYDGLKVHGRLDLKLRRRHGKTVFAKADKVKHEPIISEELFDRVQAIRAKRRRSAGGRAPVHERIYIAAKLTRCIVCGEPLRADNARGKTVYRAVHRERAIPCTTMRGRVDAASVHDYLADFIASVQLPENWHAWAMTVVRDDETTRRHERERAALRAKLARLKELVKEGIIEPDEYRADKVAIDTQLAAMQHETTAVDVDHAAAQLANLKALWADATEEERRTIVLGIVEAIWVDLDGNQVEAVQPKAWFYPLREAFPATWAFCGTDGIRTRDLLRDRQAC
jgi:site-specific DNA recombinase